jgi:hypothetical protein
MNLSAQLLCFADQIRGAAQPDGAVCLSARSFVTALERLANEARSLEMQGDMGQAALSAEYVSGLISKARWTLSNQNASTTSRELAEAVLVLTNNRHSS